MNFGEWKLVIERTPWSAVAQNRLYLFRDEPGCRIFLTHDCMLKRIEYAAEGVTIKHDDVFFADLPDDALQAIADELSRKGVKTVSDHKLEGLLEAKDQHLEDMRRLVFGKGKQ